MSTIRVKVLTPPYSFLPHFHNFSVELSLSLSLSLSSSLDFRTRAEGVDPTGRVVLLLLYCSGLGQ